MALPSRIIFRWRLILNGRPTIRANRAIMFLGVMLVRWFRVPVCLLSRKPELGSFTRESKLSRNRYLVGEAHAFPVFFFMTYCRTEGETFMRQSQKVRRQNLCTIIHLYSTFGLKRLPGLFTIWHLVGAPGRRHWSE